MYVKIIFMFAGRYVKVAIITTFRQSSSKILGMRVALPSQPPSPLINVDLQTIFYSNVALAPTVAFLKEITS